MDKEFVPYQPSLDLKELGFDEPCFAYYLNRKLNIFHSTPVNDRINSKTKDIFNSDVIVTPLCQQAFRWFRKKYGLEGYVNLSDSKEGDYFYYFNYITTNNIPNRREHCDFFIGNFKSYEEAELECLKKLIEIVKEKFAQVQNIL